MNDSRQQSSENLTSLELILLGILRQGRLSLHDVLRQAGNADPRAIAGSLNNLVERRLIRVKNSRYSINSTALTQQGIKLLRQPDGHELIHVARSVLAHLPPETPVYSQWWFPPSMIRMLIRLLVLHHPTAHSLCFIGAPSLAATFAALIPAKVTIVDIDKTVCDALTSFLRVSDPNTVQIINQDASTYKPAEPFEIVYADPPWDFHSLNIFVRRCPRAVMANGYFYISFPGHHTRPDIAPEGVYFQRILSSMRMSLIRYQAGLLTYNVPEHEFLSYSDIRGFSKRPWRQGDLATYQACSEQSISTVEERAATLADIPLWDEFSIGKKRVFLRVKEAREVGMDVPSITPIYGTAQKPSASSRELNPGSIHLWTSRNEVFQTAGDELLKQILLSFEAGRIGFEELVSEVARRMGLNEANVAAMIRDVYLKLRAILEV